MYCKDHQNRVRSQVESYCFIATCIYKQKHKQFTNFNERTNSLLSKNMYLSHFILDISVVCERWVETRTDCYIDPTSSLDHSCTSSASRFNSYWKKKPSAYPQLWSPTFYIYKYVRTCIRKFRLLFSVQY